MGHKTPWTEAAERTAAAPQGRGAPPPPSQLICHNAITQFIYLVLYFLLSLPNAGLYFIGIFAALKVM